MQQRLCLLTSEGLQMPAGGEHCSEHPSDLQGRTDLQIQHTQPGPGKMANVTFILLLCGWTQS